MDAERQSFPDTATADEAVAKFFLRLEADTRPLTEKQYTEEEEAEVLPFTGAGAVPLQGRASFTLGQMLTLWKNGGWKQNCPHCGKESYVFYWTGSVLSGRNQYQAWCPCCRKVVCGRGKNLRPVLKALS